MNDENEKVQPSPGREMSDLLPCPFCGGEAGVYIFSDALAGNGEINIGCCAVIKNGYILDQYLEKGSPNSFKNVERETIKQWNTRVR